MRGVEDKWVRQGGKYEVLQEIGSGTYGVVYKARQLSNNETVAIKQMKPDYEEEGFSSSALREICILLELQHPNVVRLREVLREGGTRKLFLVFDFLDLDLHALMSTTHFARYSAQLIKVLLYQMLSGIQYCHQRRILHRDLKPQNLLIEKAGNALQLADFGLARAFGIPVRLLSPEVVTLWYRAPELLMGSTEYSTPVDLWSIGCIFAEMANRWPLLPGQTEIDEIHKMFETLGTPHEGNWRGVSSLATFRHLSFPAYAGRDLRDLVPGLDPQGLDLLRQLLTYDPMRRNAFVAPKNVRQTVVRLAAATETQQSTQLLPNKKKVAIVSLGCPKNVVDGEVMLGDLHWAGYEVTEDHASADAIIVNTCAFVEDAKSESLEAIIAAASLNEDGKARKVIVTGCLAQRYNTQLAEDLPEVDLVLGFENYGSLVQNLDVSLGLPNGQAQRAFATLGGEDSAADAKAAGSSSSGGSSGSSSLPGYQHQGENFTTSGISRVQVGSATVDFRPEWNRFRLTPKHTAYLRVAEGCNHACTFCAIPGFRGKFRSKPWQAVLDEAKFLVASGVRELNLIAEDTNQYGQDRRDGKGLAELMAEISKLEGLDWIRILYAYPSYFTEELVNEIATNPKVCKYLDMPLQHVSNLTLLSMNRPPAAHTRSLLTKLRARIPSLALRTTFISGFPGESEEQHRELVDFCKEFKFERMGVFAYSEEQGTPASEFPSQVPQKLRNRRRDELISLQQRIGETFAASLIGTEMDVLVDGWSDDGPEGGSLVGRTQWDAPDVDPLVFLSDAAVGSGIPALEIGQMRRCKIIGNSLFDLEAVPIA
ncbi:MAG: hypothetical protein WDW36_005096 [Sanguina aurantia]